METVDHSTVQIFDTTLRDGEQSPGASMNVEEKVAIARQLEQLAVDVIEAGFAASSEGDYDSVRRVAEAVTHPIVLSLARTKEADIERAIRAVEKAKRPGIHIFIATSDIHLKHKLMMSRQEVLDAAAWAVGYARKYVEYIEFSAEDASRSDRNYMTEVFGEVIKAGAVTLNVPDTTGYALPEQTHALFRYLISSTPGGDAVRWSAHCHNDLGMAVANSLAAVQAGARQVECTVNGLGERAGNASMDEIVMALKTRHDVFGLRTNVVSEQIYSASRLVSQVTGIPIPINKPIVGDNAFAHEAGIHQDGVLKNKITYEIMRPETVGLTSNRLVLGKHSGRHAFHERLQELGLLAPEVDMNKAFARFKALADKKKDVYDADLVAIVAEESVRVPDRYELAYLNVTFSSEAVPQATVRIRVDGAERTEHATGDGMVDACYTAIKQATRPACRLERYAVKGITGGTDAQGEVSCLVRDGDRTSTGQGAHTDVIMASALAFLNALNKIEYQQRYAERVRVEGP
jgi:2-isopropylmalate synthase